MGKISNLNSYGFSEQPQFDGFINSLKEKADTTEIAEQVKKQESDIKNINDINTKQDEQILGLNVDIKQSGNAFTFTQGGKNLAVINQENGEGSSVIGGTFSNGKLTLNNSNNTSVEIDVSDGALVDLSNYYTKTDSDGRYALKTSIPSLDGYATEQWVTNKGYLTEHQDLSTYATKDELSTKADKEHTHLLKDITDYKEPDLSKYATKDEIPNLEGYATKVDVDSKQDKGDYALKSDIKPIPSVLSAFNNDVGYLTTHQDLTPYAKKTDIPSLESYATEEWVTSKKYLTSHQSLEGYAKTDYVITELGKKADAKHVHAISDVTDLQNKLEGYALKTEIQPLPKFKTVNGQAITGSTDDITITTDLSNYYKKTDTSGATEIRDALAKKQDYNENYVTRDQLADYAKKSYVDSGLSQKADNSAIPSNTIELTFTLTDGTQTTKTFYIQ